MISNGERLSQGWEQWQWCRIVALAGALATAGDTAWAADRPADVTISSRGMVVTVSRDASSVGAAVLRGGGNAVDAAVATAFALAVTYPAAGNIGGGGYLLTWPGDERPPVVFDFRERAPAAATSDMFVESTGRKPHRLVGVPGTVRGLALAHQRLGSRPWRELVEPAVELAEHGFELDAANANSLNSLLRRADQPFQQELRRVFAPAKPKQWRAGDRLVQPELARSLRLIANRGPDAFYSGRIAGQLVAEMQRGGGLVDAADLAAYRPIERKPLHGTYRGHEIYAVPPSSSGGTTLIEMLNILENFDLPHQSRWSAETLHLMAEAMKRAYRDRARYLGDPDFTTIPAKLLDKQYARELAATINPQRATPSSELAGDIPLMPEPEHTTHLSIVDGRGMAVSMTYTLESSYGSQVVVRGAGFLLNDEMRDFNWRPGKTDTVGGIGTQANVVAPGKRMLSSQCPTIVCHNGKPLLVTGSPGGRTIINTVLCVVLNVIDFDLDVRQAVDAPRMHHAWFPDRLHVEAGLLERHAEAIDKLKLMGHAVRRVREQGDAHSIWIDPISGAQCGAADRRISGAAAPAE